MERLTFVIQGQMASKSNRRRLVTMGRKSRLIKSQEAIEFTRGALLQIPVWARRRFEGPVRVRVVVYYRDNRSDLDEQLVLDCLQDQWGKSGKVRVLLQAGVYRNDRQVVQRFSYKRIDSLWPRVELTVWAMSPQQGELT